MNNEEKILEMLTKLMEDVSGLKQDVSGLKQDVSGLKQDVSVLKERVDILDERSLHSAVMLETVVSRDIGRLFEGHHEIMQKLNTLERKIDQKAARDDEIILETTVCRHTEELKDHARRIANLENAS